MLILLALLIGVIAGLRTFTAPTAASWAAHLGLLPVVGTWLGFMHSAWTVGILTALALFELVADQLPSTPSRKVPQQFGARIVSGALSGATIGVGAGWLFGAGAGVIGAVIGTLGGAAARGALARAFGRDMPAAFLEDAVAIGGAAVIVLLLP